MSYSALVCRLKLTDHPNADRLKIGTTPQGYQVVVGIETQEGELGLFFAGDGQLSEEFAQANDLIARKDDNGNRAGGFFTRNRRVREQNFRGEKSEGFWCPLSYLDYLDDSTIGHKFYVGLKEGDLLSEVTLDGKVNPICNKYFTPQTLQALSGAKQQRKANPKFAKHVDTEQLRHFIKTIPEGSVIYISEKLHGTCLIAETKVSMADGSKKQISQIEPGELVLGVLDGKVIETEVSDSFTTGKSDEWVTVKGRRSGAGRGSWYFSITCTKDHLFWEPQLGKWVPAEKLNPFSKATVVRHDRGISEVGYKPSMVIQDILSVADAPEASGKIKYDITTETGNFFANGTLVHNSGRTGYVERMDQNVRLRELLRGVISRKNRSFTTKYETLTGTRNTVLGNVNSSGYHGSDDFRHNHSSSFSHLLNPGETVYYEIVGYANGTPIMSPHDTTKLQDKKLRKQYGDQMVYSYGCMPGGDLPNDIYVYRITVASGDSFVELSWPQLCARAKQLGLKTVPWLSHLVYWQNKDLQEYVNLFVEGSSKIDLSHIREGVVLRVEKPDGQTVFYKEKSYDFKVLEGIAKESDDLVDLEEVS